MVLYFFSRLSFSLSLNLYSLSSPMSSLLLSKSPSPALNETSMFCFAKNTFSFLINIPSTFSLTLRSPYFTTSVGLRSDPLFSIAISPTASKSTAARYIYNIFLTFLGIIRSSYLSISKLFSIINSSRILRLLLSRLPLPARN